MMDKLIYFCKILDILDSVTHSVSHFQFYNFINGNEDGEYVLCCSGGVHFSINKHGNSLKFEQTPAIPEHKRTIELLNERLKKLEVQ